MGMNNWIGEDRICEIKRSIRFSSLDDDNIKIKNVGKHFYASQGRVLSKYEFVFTVTDVYDDPLSLNEVFSSLMSLEVRIKDTHLASVPINKLQEQLKQHYIRNTTRKDKIAGVDPETVLACVPQLYVYLDAGERVKEKGIRFNRVEGAKPAFPFSLRGSWYQVFNTTFRVWLHERKTVSGLIDLNRALRISILRLHSEYSCISKVLEAIYKEVLHVTPFSDESQRLQRYLYNAYDIISKDNKYLDQELSVNNFLSYFQEKFDELRPGESAILKKQIESSNFRPHTKQQVFTIIDKLNVMTTNNISHSQGFTTGNNSNVQGTFNQINNNVPADLDYEALSAELSKLKDELHLTAKTPEEFTALATVANAEAEARNKNGNKVVEYLKQGGKWVIDTANKIGVGVVAKLIADNIHGLG
ncbi:hypothetical protein Cpin_3190 [Chitinophaga pinensis DSM 2588]|uniref:Uncharacterized protein n=2 Tax=Chitinophaga pinensis TaxID=79329 RepID=A0A979G486_CHIPD|nr:hypothetical protein Cpin_3190 [Chitinophaga pinensis DSM 2588]